METPNAKFIAELKAKIADSKLLEALTILREFLWHRQRDLYRQVVHFENELLVNQQKYNRALISGFEYERTIVSIGFMLNDFIDEEVTKLPENNLKPPISTV